MNILEQENGWPFYLFQLEFTTYSSLTLNESERAQELENIRLILGAEGIELSDHIVSL